MPVLIVAGETIIQVNADLNKVNVLNKIILSKLFQFCETKLLMRFYAFGNTLLDTCSLFDPLETKYILK